LSIALHPAFRLSILETMTDPEDDPLSQTTSYHPGQLLLASPALRDSNFMRAVIFLTEHNPEGAHGFVLNMPIDTTAGHLLPDAEDSELADVPVFHGGPVAIDKLTFARLQWNEDTMTFVFESQLSAEDALEGCRLGDDIRAFIGYAGWTEGQLENELAETTWYTHLPESAIADQNAIPLLWTTLMNSKSPIHELMTRTPHRPELN